MKTYIAILRGINVSGQKLIKMAALKKMGEKLNFENIQTYLQSGNLIFSAKENDPKQLEKIITTEIEKEFGFEVPVIVLNLKTLERIIENNPFPKDPQKEMALVHVTFLSEPSVALNEEKIFEKKKTNEEIVFSSNAVYLYCPDGYGKTKLHNNFLEKQLQVKATTRNWKTTINLQNIASEIENS